MFMAAAQGGGARPVSTPLQVYRVYPDGKEELVRGLRLRGLSVANSEGHCRSLDESYVFHYLNTLAPMSMPGSGYVVPTSVIAPSLLLLKMSNWSVRRTIYRSFRLSHPRL